MAGTSVAVLSVTTVALLWLRTAALGGQPLMQATDLMPVVMRETHYGHVWTIRLAALSLGILGWIETRCERHGPAAWAFMLAAAAVLGFTRSASGHAADIGDFSLPEIVDWLHVLAMSVWVGGVLGAAFIVLPVFSSASDSPRKPAVTFATRFSFWSGWSLAVVAGTGLYNAWARLGSLGAMADTRYGEILSVKVVLVAIVVALGAINRFVHVRRLLKPFARNDGPPRTPHHQRHERTDIEEGQYAITIRSFLCTVRIEAGVMLAVLLMAGFLQQETPPAHMENTGTMPEMSARLEHHGQ